MMDLNNVMATRSDINEMLNKVREFSNKSAVSSEKNKVQSSHGFEEVMSLAKNAVGEVSKAELNSENIKTAFITGEGNVSMSQVIVASQKSKLAFEGLLSVRNKILEAYKEIMNMPV